MRRFSFVLCWAVAVFLGGCQDEAAPGGSASGQDIGLLGDATQVGTGDSWTPAFDGGSGSGGTGTTAAGAGFGSPCTDNSDCFSGYCVEGPEGNLCTKLCEADCPTGFSCRAVGSETDAVFICLPEVQKVCTPCAVDYECGVGACLGIDGEGRCSYECESDDDCPGAGYVCATQPESDDPETRWCLPQSNSCWCTADTAGTPRSCSNFSEYGTCYGIETCDPTVGWVGCNAKVPEEEVCNGLDDDCDSLVDEDLIDGGPCEKTVEGVGVCTGMFLCTGNEGYSCQAQDPELETCDFADNDCDGQTDESFTDALGEWTLNEHCGTCGNDCTDKFKNGTGTCGGTPGSPVCVVESCDPDYVKLNDYQCVLPPDVSCQPCLKDAACYGGSCVDLDGQKVCLSPCGAIDQSCAEGYSCQELETGVERCVPNTNSCVCSMETDGQIRACVAANEYGKCFGEEVCVGTDGWTGCTASEPAAEVCNGLDDDCNGAVDDSVITPEEDCAQSNEFGTCEGNWFCGFGDDSEVNWTCSAIVPQEDLCDYLDNDCDGVADQSFKAPGTDLYVHGENCGACGISCAGAIPNATAACMPNDGKPRCEVESCADGYYKAGPLTCLPTQDSLCAPCETSANCANPGDACVPLDGALFCGRDCSEGNVYDSPAGTCPPGFACMDQPDGGAQCVPESASCDCLPNDVGKTRLCSQENGFGTCFGEEECTADQGWIGCTATEPLAEVCNGLDDDCDGVVDDALVEPEEACENANEWGLCAGSWFCGAGADGEVAWTCSAQVPSEEICDYQDNDCDGVADQVFKLEPSSLYVDDQHCGACGVSCDVAIPNAIATCVPNDGSPRCEVASCLDGYEQAGPLTCLPKQDSLCQPCETAVTCAGEGDACISLDGAMVCARDCGPDNSYSTPQGVCPDGFTCEAQEEGGHQCVPQSGSCDCLDADVGKSRLCSLSNGFGTCVGQETCTADGGWQGCTALEPSVELCNGVDDDCNGAIDDGAVAPEATCELQNEWGTCQGAWACGADAAGEIAWQCNAPVPTEDVCDYQDNDCDGVADQEFKAPGTDDYVDDQNCGACGVSCAEAIPNATASCASNNGKPRCEVAECADGYYKAGPLTCLPVEDSACLPCENAQGCANPGDACIEVDGAMVCGRDCSAGNVYGDPEGTCPAGFECLEQADGGKQCAPKSASCDCLLADAGKARQCSNSNVNGVCFGSETCDPEAGWVGCTAAEPAPEVCDGVDNNCNALEDDVAGIGDSCSIENAFGSCQGTLACGADSEELVCVGDAPAEDLCDYLDNDCDGETDEAFTDLYEACSAGIGVCERFGFQVCTADGSGLECNAQAADPSDEVCNGLDDNCDGDVDETWAELGEICFAGEGVCQGAGVWICADDAEGIECSATPSEPGVESCNGVDDDCNGVVDEPWLDVDSGLYENDEACGSCYTDCTEIFDKPSAYGVCATETGDASCDMLCIGGFFDMNGVPDDGCEFELATDAIYVSKTDAAAADDAGCGLGPVGTGDGHYPCASVSHGLSRASSTGKGQVLVAGGSYGESVTLIAGVDLLGGYNSANWSRDWDVNLTVIQAPAGDGHRRSVIADGITESTVLQGFAVYGRSATEQAMNSYGIWAHGCSDALQILDNEIYAGDGAPGAQGSAGSSGLDGTPGSPGVDAMEPGNKCNITSGGGEGGARTCGAVSVNGGAGGDAVCSPQADTQTSGQDGDEGDNNGIGAGLGGGGGWDGATSGTCGLCSLPDESMTGGHGTNGSDGTDGALGGGCSDAVGSVVDGHWVAGAGSTGAAGTAGGGGGGGGAGGGGEDTSIGQGSCYDDLGGTGGGGGSGACGGSEGLGGGGGGASFGVFISGGSSAPVLSGNTVEIGYGGSGGAGGSGGVGGSGGDGAAGGVKQTGLYVFCTGDAGSGGDGGAGGHGGGGGGGCGGAAVGIWASDYGGGATGYSAGNSFVGGSSGGSAGAGGASLGNSGEDGQVGLSTSVHEG